MIDIHEEIFSPESLGESIVQPTGRARRIVAAVVDEDSHQHCRTTMQRPILDPTLSRDQARTATTRQL